MFAPVDMGTRALLWAILIVTALLAIGVIVYLVLPPSEVSCTFSPAQPVTYIAGPTGPTTYVVNHATTQVPYYSCDTCYKQIETRRYYEDIRRKEDRKGRTLKEDDLPQFYTTYPTRYTYNSWRSRNSAPCFFP